MLSRVHVELAACPNMMFIAVFCFLHQVHLVVKDLLTLLEQWQWGGLFAEKKYWSTVATVANVWRSVGMPAKIVDAAYTECQDDNLARRLFKKLPGKPLRGRWGSVAAIEEVVSCAAAFIGKVFKRVLDPLLNTNQKVKADVGADEEA
eukprot:5600752-Pyramimonas_sp.AAC.1